MKSGGYGQTSLGESLGGPTYCALASMHLVPAEHPCTSQARLQPTKWHATVRWLLHMQPQQTPQTQMEAKMGGGFAGRTNELADACYGFWCGAALAVRPFSLSIPSRSQLTTYPTGPRPISKDVSPPSSPTTLQPCLAKSDPWRRSFTRCPRARRFWKGANTSLVGLAKRRTSILVSILCAITLPSGFYIVSSRLRKLNACFRRSIPHISVDRSSSNHIARSGMETATPRPAYKCDA
jgi:hypothetical protein